MGRPGGQLFWQLVAEGCGVTVPMPGSYDATQVESVDAGEVRGSQQQVAEVVHNDEVVEPMREAQTSGQHPVHSYRHPADMHIASGDNVMAEIVVVLI